MFQDVLGLVNLDGSLVDKEVLGEACLCDEAQSNPKMNSICLGASGAGICFIKESRTVDYSSVQVEKSKLTVIFNGEIYNADELRREFGFKYSSVSKKNSELILNLYKEPGISFAKRINGFFSIIIWDDYERKLIILRDRFGGSSPLYYLNLGKSLFFSTTLKSFLKLREWNKSINTKALISFLKYSYIPSPLTIFAGLNKVRPGEALICEQGIIRTENILDFAVSKIKFSDKNKVKSIYTSLLRESIRRRIRQNEKISSLLSGGLDSSAIVALSSEFIAKPFHTFGVGFGVDAFDERRYAKVASDKFNTTHHELLIDGDYITYLPEMIWYMEEPFMEAGLFLNYGILKEVKNYADVVLCGDGADQIFGVEGQSLAMRTLLDAVCGTSLLRGSLRGISKFALLKNGGFDYKVINKLNKVVDFNRWFLFGFDDYELLRLFNKDNGFISEAKNISLNGKKFKSFDDIYEWALINLAVKNNLNECILVKSRQMAKAFSIIARMPFLDNALVDFLNSLDVNFRYKSNIFDSLLGYGIDKYLHRISMDSILPQEILNKPKQGGFVPLTIFFKNNEVRHKIFSYLLNSDVLKQFFNVDYIEFIIKRYEEGISFKQNFWFRQTKSNQILNLLVFELWYQLFMKNRPYSETRLVLDNFLKIKHA